MNKYSGFFKRAQTWLLAVAIVLSVVNPALWLSSYAVGSDDNSKTTSDGKIVAENYDLTDTEKAILGSGFMIGESHTYKVPVSAEDLISVDETAKSVTVESYEGTDGYVWKPVSAKIVVGDEVKETVALDSKGKGTYIYDGNAFSVKVDYELRIDVDEATQSTLLNTPAYLVQGLENLSDIASISADLGLIEEAMPTLVKLTTTGVPVTLPYFGTVPITITREDATNIPAIDAITALNAQMSANASGKLDLTDKIAEYQNAENKLQYLFDHGEEIKVLAAEVHAYISDIKNSDFFSNQIPSYASLGGGENAVMLNLLISTFGNVIDGLEAPVADSWDAINETIFARELSGLEYLALETLVNSIATATDHLQTAIKNPLLVDTTTLQYNMSMWNVDVKVVLNVTDKSSAEIKFLEYASESTTVTLVDGATKDEILQAVEDSGIVADALTAWAGTYVDGKFTVSATALPNELGKDIEYVITYTPAYYDVNFAYGETVEYPYGYVLTFEKHADDTKVYDYEVNGKYYPQGTLYTVEDTTDISRKEGKPYVDSDLYQIVADNYLTTDKGVSILTSGALFGNYEVDVRYPDNSNKIVTLEGNELTAAPYEANYEGLVWAAYSYKLSNGTVGYFNSASTVEINEVFDYVTVEYRLYLTNVDDDTLLDIVNLPDLLAAEAEDQLAALKLITSQQSNLEMLNKTMVSILAGLVEDAELNSDPVKNTALKECFRNVLESIETDCMGANNLYLYDIVSEYNASSDGLRYYYLNSDKVINEISKFAGLMSDMLGDDATLTSDEKVAALETLMRSLPSNILSPDKVDEYIGKLTTLESSMNSVVAALKAPNAIINLESADLGKLTAALTSDGDTQGFDKLSSEKLHLSDSSIVVVADNKVVITVTVNVEGKTQTVTSTPINYGATIDAVTINALISEIENAKAGQGVVDKYFNNNYNSGAALKALVGTKANSDTVSSYEFSWTYAEFDVKVPGTATQKVTLKDREISLPASTSPEYRIDYTVDGILVSDTSYTLTVAQLDKLIAGKLVITANTVYVLEEDLTDFVNKLNDSVGNDDIVFALVENNGEYSIVMKLNVKTPQDLMGSVPGVAMGMVQGKYAYIGIGGNAFMADSKIYLQAAVDALMNSGFGSESLIKLVNSDGSINNMTVKGTVISNKNIGAMGGKLVESTMELGSNASSTTSVKFYMTLASSPEQLTQLRNLLAGRLKNTISFTCDDGQVAMNLNLPDKAYEAMLAVLLVTEEIDLSDIDAVNSQIVIEFINDILMPALNDGTSVETFENTLKKFGFSANLSTNETEQIYNMLVDFYTGANFTYDEDSGTADATLDISAIINSLDIGPLADMIAEKDTGLAFRFDLALEDLGKDYEALYVDINAEGITNKAGLATNVSSVLANAAGTTVIVLLDDVASDLTINKTTLLNLNGFTVNGGINGNGKVVIVDSRISDDAVGTVKGAVSGNVSIVAGKYSKDVTAFLKSGYVQGADGVVTNNFYDIIRDKDGNITVELEAGILNTSEMPGVTNLVIDVVCDLIFNGYTNNYLDIDANLIYNVTLDDLVGLYASSNRTDATLNEVMEMIDSEQLSAFINTVLDDVLDFGAIGNAIKNDAPILSYTANTKAWGVEIVRVEDGDYLTASIVSSGTTRAQKINVVVVGSDEDKALLADQFAELGETTDADVNVNISHGLNNKDILLEVTADANVFVDFTNPDYAVMFSIIVADGIGAPANSDLVYAINNFYETKNLAALQRIFNSLTTAQVITALKNLAANDDFSDMVSALGLDGVVGSDVAELERLYDRVGKLAAAVVRKADLQGGNRTLGSFLDADGAYGVSRANIERLLDAGLFRGYTAIADLELAEVYVGLKLFGDDLDILDPEFVDGTGTPEILDSYKVKGYKVIDSFIIIDGHTDGITALELSEILKFHALNADNIAIVFADGEYAWDANVANGTKVKAIATNRVSDVVAEVEYTIIILGDVNGNGRLECRDTVLISQYLVDMIELSDIQLLAADINNNGRVDVGDASLTSFKIVDWANYQSRYDEE